MSVSGLIIRPLANCKDFLLAVLLEIFKNYLFVYKWEHTFEHICTCEYTIATCEGQKTT